MTGYLDADKLGDSSVQSENHDPFDDERTRMSSRGVWIRAAEALVSSGAAWDSKWRSATGASQLHLLLEGFPAPPQLASAYRNLLQGALAAGLGPNIVDIKGTSCLTVLCARMATVSSDSCPDAGRLMRMLLEAADRSNPSSTTVGTLSADNIAEIDTLLHNSSVAKSCLSSVRPMMSSSSSLKRGARAI